MGLIDWIRKGQSRTVGKQENPSEPEFDLKAHGHRLLSDLAAEIRHDEALGRLRDETGREPESNDPKFGHKRGRGMER